MASPEGTRTDLLTSYLEPEQPDKHNYSKQTIFIVLENIQQAQISKALTLYH